MKPRASKETGRSSQRVRKTHVQPPDLDTLMLSGLGLTGTERVLEIGAGSGRLTALLAREARELFALEIDPDLAERTRGALKSLGHQNVHVIAGDGSRGWPDAAPYQAIVVGAGVREVPPELLAQLETGGRLVIPLGDADWQLVERFRKRVDGLDTETLGGCRLGMLVGARKTPSRFPWSST